jgi:hypothetical protein
MREGMGTMMKLKEKKAPTRAHTTMNVLGGLMNPGNEVNRLSNIMEEKVKEKKP